MKPVRDLDRLQTRLQEIGVVLLWSEERLRLCVESVSEWTPAQHVDHTLRGLDWMARTIETLERGSDEDILKSPAPRVQGRLILWSGIIPRGRGEAPPALLPSPDPLRRDLCERLPPLQERIGALGRRADRLHGVRGALPHPLLGAFDAAQWARFAELHTRHHLAIVADIDRLHAVGAAEPVLPEGEQPDLDGVGAEAR